MNIWSKKTLFNSWEIFLKSKLELLPIITAVRYKYTGMVIKKIIYLNK